MLKFGVITVSTTCSEYPENDAAGPKLERQLLKTFPGCQVTFKRIVGDDKQEIVNILEAVVGSEVCDVIFTVGGTGFAPSDVTPEATKSVIEKEAPGLSYVMISRSLAVTEMAMLSRPVCGIKNKSIIINLPGSAKASLECFGFIESSIPHAVALLRNDGIGIKTTHQRVQGVPRDERSSIVGKSKVEIQAGAARSRQSAYPMLELDRAKNAIFESLHQASEETEDIPVEDALTRILAEDVRAPKPVPPFPASTKDGYAVRAADGPGRRTVRAAIAAGDHPEIEGVELQSGEAIRISTGAPVPLGADAVVQVEDTALIESSEDGEEEKVIHVNVTPKKGQDIRQIGSDVAENTVVLEKHSPVTAAYVGVLAMLGFTSVKVVRRPAIGAISTGNELQPPTEILKPGQIHDSNKVTLLSLLKSYGYKVADCGIARDTPNSVKATLQNALERNDFIISSGGVSMGEYDLLKQVLVEDFGAVIRFGRVNMKPGKPTVFATLEYRGRKKVVFALPGNPVSCCVTCLLFVVPALKRIEKDKLFNGWPRVQVRLENDLVNRDSRPEFVRVTIFRDHTDDKLVAKSTGNQISSRLNSMVNANGLLMVPGNIAYKAGSIQSASLFGQLV